MPGFGVLVEKTPRVVVTEVGSLCLLLLSFPQFRAPRGQMLAVGQLQSPGPNEGERRARTFQGGGAS